MNVLSSTDILAISTDIPSLDLLLAIIIRVVLKTVVNFPAVKLNL